MLPPAPGGPSPNFAPADAKGRTPPPAELRGGAGP